MRSEDDVLASGLVGQAAKDLKRYPTEHNSCYFFGFIAGLKLAGKLDDDDYSYLMSWAGAVERQAGGNPGPWLKL